MDPKLPLDSRPVVLFLHGATLNPGMWALACEAFEPNYRCITPDLPGHGARRHEPFRFDAALGVVREAIGDAPSVSVVGESLGGYVALALAPTLGTRLRALVVSGASSNFGGLAYVPWWLQKTLSHALEAVLGAARLRRLVDEKLERTLPPKLATAILETGLRLEAFDEAVAELARRDFLAEVPRIAAPILFVNGSKDTRQCWQEPRFVRAARDARTARLDGAAHGVSLWNAEWLARLAREFVDRHAAQRAA